MGFIIIHQANVISQLIKIILRFKIRNVIPHVQIIINIPTYTRHAQHKMKCFGNRFKIIIFLNIFFRKLKKQKRKNPAYFFKSDK